MQPQDVNYKFYQDPHGTYQVLPGANVAPGFREVNFDEFKKGASQTGFFDSGTNLFHPEFSTQQQAYDAGYHNGGFINQGQDRYTKLLSSGSDVANVIRAAELGQTTKYGQTDTNGNLVSSQAQQTEQAHQAAVANGTEKIGGYQNGVPIYQPAQGAAPFQQGTQGQPTGQTGGAPLPSSGQPQNGTSPIAGGQNQPAQAGQGTSLTPPTAPISNYTGLSVTDYLNSIGQPSSFAARAQIAAQNGIQNYTGTAAQNTQLLNTLRKQGASSPTTVNAGIGSSTAQTGQTTPLTETGKSPMQNVIDTYTQVYTQLGLGDIKTQYQKILSDQKALTDKQNEEISNVSNNPWLSQSVRDKTIEGINNKYSTKQDTLTHSAQLMDSLFKEGQQEAQFLVGHIETDMNNAIQLAQKKQDAIDALQKDNQVVSVNGREVLVNKATGKKVADLGASKVESPGITVNGSSSNGSDYSDVIQTILGSGKFTKEQQVAVVNAIQKGGDPIAVIKNQAKNIMGQTEATKVTNFEVAKSQLQDIDAALKQFYANGGNTSLLSGTYEKAINKLGNVDNPKLVDLATQIQSALQIYRNAVSGTAYSVQEGADIASIFPGINKSQGLNTSILKGRTSAFDSTIDGSYRSVLGNGYDKLKNPTGSSQLNTSSQSILSKYGIK